MVQVTCMIAYHACILSLITGCSTQTRNSTAFTSSQITMHFSYSHKPVDLNVAQHVARRLENGPKTPKSHWAIFAVCQPLAGDNNTTRLCVYKNAQVLAWIKYASICCLAAHEIVVSCLPDALWWCKSFFGHTTIYHFKLYTGTPLYSHALLIVKFNSILNRVLLHSKMFCLEIPSIYCNPCWFHGRS